MQIMDLLGKYWPYLLIIIGVIGGIIKDIRDDQQQDNIELSSSKTLDISKEIKNLEDINSKVTANVEALSKETNNLSSKNLELTGTAKKITEENLNLAGQTNALINSLGEITAKLNEIQIKLYNEVTGGNSFPFAHVYRRKDDEANIRIENRGEYPLNDLLMVVRDIDIYSSNNKSAIFDENVNVKKIIIGTLGSKGNNIYDAIVKLNMKDIRFVERNIRIEYSCKNANFIQFIKLREGYKTASIVFRTVGNRQVKFFEEIDPNFLNKNESFIDWEPFMNKNIAIAPLEEFIYETK